jgi:hypothetical protein
MLGFKLLSCKRYLYASYFVRQFELYSKKKHMLRLLLVKKYLFLLFALLFTSIPFVKADTLVYSPFCDSNNTNWLYTISTPADQLDDITKKEPSFYPNPVRDIVNLTNQDNVTRIRVISLTGKTLIDIKIPKKTINLSHLAKGMYLINFDMKDGKRVARKLVKK